MQSSGSSGLNNLKLYDSSDSDNDNNDGSTESRDNANSDHMYDQRTCIPRDGKVLSDTSTNSLDEPRESLESCRKRPRLEWNTNDGEMSTAIHSRSQNVQLTEFARNNNANAELLPLPSPILQMFSNDIDRREDDPSIHNGRTRSFPHVRGNWPSYLYLPCPSHLPSAECFTTLIEDARTHFKNDLTIHLINDLHLSVSRTLPFRHHWIDPFFCNLKKLLVDFQRIDLYFDKFEVYTNDEKSRTFIGMKVITTSELMKLVEICDSCLAEFHLETYYKNPSFHISCAWMLNDQKSWAEATLLPMLNQKWTKLLEEETDLQSLKVDSLEFKTGNKLYRFQFT